MTSGDPMQKMIAASPLRYGTRHLSAGEEFLADPKHARALAAVGKARVLDVPAVSLPELPPHDSITMLRAEYERVFGKRPFMGWGEATLREKIAANEVDND